MVLLLIAIEFDMQLQHEIKYMYIGGATSATPICQMGDYGRRGNIILPRPSIFERRRNGGNKHCYSFFVYVKSVECLATMTYQLVNLEASYLHSKHQINILPNMYMYVPV